MAETTNSKFINAPPHQVFQALADPKSIEVWQVPGDMTGKIHHFDFKPGGKYEMSLFYPDADNTQGKSGDKEDKFAAEFVEIIPDKKIVEKIHFDSGDPNLQDAMIMQIDLAPESKGTNVTISFKNIPQGVKPEDNEEGTISSLEKLAQIVEGK
ncbi:SRPBCC domain-containing protein [Pseudochryseolinea flava]|uniref:ATPase n=1 Tax=Pseudochryseolinea flava TaxID=2059302 RepID=A0A364XUR5_9BACT|nr:SRPBCC domain-containing protein [Pseudochryseolinea flava]RAV98041.1 ATPase [Pseudochryseolinea flava]